MGQHTWKPGNHKSQARNRVTNAKKKGTQACYKMKKIKPQKEKEKEEIKKEIQNQLENKV